MKLVKALTFGLYRSSSDTSSTSDKETTSAPSPSGSRSSSPSRRRPRLSMMKRRQTDDIDTDDVPRTHTSPSLTHARFSKFFPHKSHDPKPSRSNLHDAEHTPVVDGLDFTIHDRDLEIHRVRTGNSNQMSMLTSRTEPCPWTDDMPMINHPLHFDSSIGTGFGPSP